MVDKSEGFDSKRVGTKIKLAKANDVCMHYRTFPKHVFAAEK